MAQIKINGIIYGTADATEIIYRDKTVADKLDEMIILDIDDNADINSNNDYLTYANIVNSLESEETNKALSAKQGKTLNEKINNLDSNVKNNITSLSNIQGSINEINSNISNNRSLISTNQNSITSLNNKVPFSFGIDANGNYGYKKAGADTVIPFSKIVKGTSTYSGYSKATKVTIGFKPRVVFAYCTTGNGYIISWFYAEGLVNINLRRSTSNYTNSNFISVAEDGFSWTSIDHTWGSQTITYVAAR